MVFDLFDGPAGSGDFTSVTVTPDAGLSGTFDPATGQVTLVNSTGTAPTLNFTAMAGGVLQFSWSGPYQLLYQTNSLTGGLSTNWLVYPVSSNPVSVTNDPNMPAVFFGLGPQ